MSPTYRLYPDAKYPEFIEDAAAALAWTKKNAAVFGGDPDRIFVTGHSAGGYLTACLALMPEFLTLRVLPVHMSAPPPEIPPLIRVFVRVGLPLMVTVLFTASP